MFNISIPIPTPENAFKRLSSNMRRLPWYEKNNRPKRLAFYRKQNHPLINDMLVDCLQTKNPDSTDCLYSDAQLYAKYFKRFKSELYDARLYAPLIEKIQESLSIVQDCYPKFQAMEEAWGFKIFSEYEIALDIFSVGGKYQPRGQKGIVILGLGAGFSAQEMRTVVHEMLHLGIEELIINPRGDKPVVEQEEKERIVDNLCIYVLGDKAAKRKTKDGTLTPYQSVAEKCAYMDAVVGVQPKTNLVQSVQRYLNEKGR